MEGVTGSGKSSILGALRAICSFAVFDEEITFGDFMGDLASDPKRARLSAVERMTRVLDSVETSSGEQKSSPVLLERFHLSHFALDDDWEAYGRVDERCADLGFKVLLLALPDAEFAARALYREEYDCRDWQGFLSLYGSEANALHALRRSQQNRFDGLTRSAMEHLVIDTGAKAWKTYALQIAAWAGWIPR